MYNFFEKQDSAKSRSRAFFIAFTFSVIGAVIIFYFLITACLLLAGLFSPFTDGFHSESTILDRLIQYSLPDYIYGSPRKIIALKPMLIMIPAIGLFILLLSYYKTKQVKAGGGAYIAQAMGGILIRSPKNDDEKRLLNVVEEMALASGLPCPRIYILPKEISINAITAGLNHEDAIIAVTHGALKCLDRDELQGVIGHEYAHILNGDYALNLTMVGWLYGLLFFSVQGRDMMVISKEIMDKNSGDNKNSILDFLAIPMYFFGILLWIGGWVGKLAAELTQAALSRQREEMADAFAVQFTRNPQGLAGALKKIAAFPKQGFIKNGQALMMRSFFIASPSRLRGLLRSHPPIEARISVLEPHWNGELPIFNEDELMPLLNAKNKFLKANGSTVQAVKKSKNELFNITLNNMGQEGADWIGTLVLGMLAGHAGQYDNAAESLNRSLEISSRLYEEIPSKLREALDEESLILALVASVFIHDDSLTSEKQINIIRNFLDENMAQKALDFKSMMNPAFRLPLLSMASPRLKDLNNKLKSSLAKTVKAIATADGKLDLFELAAIQILKKSLNISYSSSSSYFDIRDPNCAADYLAQVQTSVVVILSILARLGNKKSGEEKINKAFQAGLVHFSQWPSFEVAPPEAVTSKELILALECLELTPVKIKNTLILAALSTALDDNYISSEEYELLRALAAALDIPLPYFANPHDNAV